MLERLKSEFSFMRGNLLTLIITWLFFYFAFSLVLPFESPYIRELGASPTILGLMGSVGAALFSIVQIPGAYIADKFGRRQIIVTMTFALSFTYVIYALAPDWRFVLFGMLLANLTSIYQPALLALEADSISPEKRGMGYAAANVIPHVPTIFAPAVAGFVVERVGLVPGMRLIYVAVFFCILAAAIIRLFFLRETLISPSRIVLGEMKGALKNSLGSIVTAWKLMPSNLRFLTVARLLSAFEEPIWFTFMSLYVFDVVQISLVDWGLVNTAYVAAILLIGFPLGKVVDKIGRRNSLILAYVFIFTPFSVFFILSKTFVQLLLAYLFFAVGRGLVMPAYSALQADIIPRDKRGRIMGTIGTLNVLAMVPASALAGVLYEVNPAWPFILSMAFALLVGAVIFLTVREPRKKEI
jgi:MFS family permease